MTTINVAEIDLQKLSLQAVVTPSPERDAPTAKRQKTAPADIVKLRPLYNGNPLTQIRVGKLKQDPNDSTQLLRDPVVCWRGAQFWDDSNKTYYKIRGQDDVDWAKAIPKKQGKKRTAKLMFSLELENGSEGSAVKAFFERYRQLIIDAFVNGVPDEAGKVVIPPLDTDGTPAKIVDTMFGEFLNIPTEVNKNTGQPYKPELKSKVRVFVNEDSKTGHPSSLSTSLHLYEYKPSDAVKDVAIADVFAYSATHGLEGSFVVQLGEIEYSRNIKRIVVPIDTTAGRVMPVARGGMSTNVFE